jgi:hypothetical protein
MAPQILTKSNLIDAGLMEEIVVWGNRGERGLQDEMHIMAA